MAQINQETKDNIHELQNLEQSISNLMMQKQAFRMELSETENAIKEISSTKDEIYKMIGNIMIKADKKETEGDLKRKQELLSLRLKSIEKQEHDLTNKVEELRSDIMKKIK